MWFKSIQSWTWYILYCVLHYILCQWSENDWVWVCFVAIHILCLVYLWARFIDFLSRYLGWSGYNDNNWFCVIYWSSWPQKPTADFFDAVCHFVVISYLAYYIYKQVWSKFWPQNLWANFADEDCILYTRYLSILLHFCHGFDLKELGSIWHCGNIGISFLTTWSCNLCWSTPNHANKKYLRCVTRTVTY